MTIIQIKGNKAQILGEKDYRFLDGLDLELSYMLLGVEFSPAFIKNRWDGKTRLLRPDLSFPIGLIPRVVEFYKKSDKEVSITDLNTYSEPTPIDILTHLKKINKIPRPYQIKAAECAIKQKRGILKICTGAGKTLIAALIIAAIGKKAILYVIGTDLLHQTHKFFEDVFQRPIGKIGDGECQIEDITICSIWTVGKVLGINKNKISYDDEQTSKEKEIKEEYYDQIKKFIRSSVVNIVDEVHIAASQTVQKISSEMCGEYSIGLSASPYRDDRSDLLIEAVFGKIIVNISASELIAQGFLVKPVIKFISVPKPKYMLEKTYREIYSTYIVRNEVRNELILKAAKSLTDQGFITLILYKEIIHGKYLYEQLIERGIKCHLLNGSNSSDVRQDVIQEVISGKCNLILASSIFDLGVDISNLSGLILAGSGKSSVRAIQRIGRVIRPSKGKDMAAIIEFDDKVKYLREHALIRRRIYESEEGFEVI